MGLGHLPEVRSGHKQGQQLAISTRVLGSAYLMASWCRGREQVSISAKWVGLSVIGLERLGGAYLVGADGHSG